MRYRCAVLASVLIAIFGIGCSRHEAPVPETPVSGGGGAQANSYSPPPGLVAGGNCALDAVGGVSPAEARPRSGETLVFAGWVSDADGKAPDRAYLVLVGGASSFQFRIRVGDSRPDVAAAFGNPALGLSGYNALINLVNVPPGSYRISILMTDAAPVECSPGAEITIDP